ncbi:ABC transporter permease [Halococcus agarilyticus]|uniref:ABC transporter permease n=1 Tax=Halococcus agarilyticus TaxID=1232219 RepID=UPI00067804DE|nr:ABC transporter permease [Halococcus agarilyticus]
MIADAIQKVGGALAGEREGPLRDGRVRQYGLAIFGLVCFLVIWQATALLVDVSSTYFPGPIDVVTELQRIWGVMLLVLPNTLAAVSVGYVASLILSILVAIPIVASDRLRSALMPFVVGMNTIPRIAVTPLAIYWMGFVGFLGLSAANYVMATWVAFFPMLIAAIDGFRSVDERTENMLDLLGAGTWEEFRYVRFQNGLPFIFDGMKIGFILAMIGAVVGEFVSTTPGIGSMAKSVIGRAAVGRAVAIVLILGVISAGVVLVIFLIERRVVHWRDSSFMGEQ